MEDKDIELLWKSCWEQELKSRLNQTDVPKEMWKAGGRVSKTYPNKEDEKWWAKNGVKQLANWIQFRNNNWNIFDIDGVPAIEIDILAMMDGIPVKMQIDRVMVTPEGELVIVDIKSGRTTPTWLQLAFYAAGMDIVFGIRPKWGTYWMSRTGVAGDLIDLDKYPTKDIVSLVKQFEKARKNEVFLPNLSHCSRCGFTSVCKWK